MNHPTFMIYGSYGYTGNLVVKQALKDGLKPMLAGRNAKKLEAQANLLGLPYRCFNLNNLEETKKALQGVIAVAHCAGPFVHTYQNMLDACLATKTHYLDITGEIKVIENVSKRNEEALKANIMVMSGAGFDVVPTDCLAMYLKEKLPDATSLTLALNPRSNGVSSGTGLSHGTARTALENLSEPSFLRDEAVLKHRQGIQLKTFNFGDKTKMCMGFSWGDIASAWWSTHIPHIETYISTSKKQIKAVKFLNTIRFILKWDVVKYFLKKRIDKTVTGPSEEELRKGTIRIYGEVTNSEGKSIHAVLETGNGYAFTAYSVIAIIKNILKGDAPPGFQTPSTAYSKDFVLSIPGTQYINSEQA